MALSQQERTLRLMTVWSWIPGMALLIPFGVITHTLVPALGLVPLTISSVFGLAKLYGFIKDDYHVHAVTIYAATMDGLITVLLLGMTIPGIVVVVSESGESYRFGADLIPMLGCFAIFPLLLNISIHNWFLLRETSFITWVEDLVRPRICQYCQRDLRTAWDMKVENSGRASNTIATPAEQSTASPLPAAMPDSAPPRLSTSTSALTTPRPSTDYDAETLDGREGSIRSSHSTLKIRDAGDAV